MEKREIETAPHRFGRCLLTACLFAIALAAIQFQSTYAQGRGAASSDNEAPAAAANRSAEIQRLIERSNSYFQTGEANFRDGNYEKARREYDRAIDIVLESGLGVSSDARLQQYYQNLVDLVFQRQMTLLSGGATPAGQNAANQTDQAQNRQTPAQDEKGNPDRGFGQQVYAPSPLDELTKLKLTEEETKDVTEEQTVSAVAAANLDFKFKPNAMVQGFINYYTGRGRASMEQGLRRSGRFLAMARKIFKEEGVPQDIVWLGQVESAWSPVARSWAAAVGLWQFIPATGARYGLRQDYYVDERSSFEKATRASARYLKWLANRYDGNWELAMAAYNSGEGRIDSAIARSGYADFWEIYSRGLIPQETKNYVPNILATIIIAKNPEKYGFKINPEPPLTYDYVRVNNVVDLRLVADATDTNYEFLQMINPDLKRGITPPGVDHLLRLPTGKGQVLHDALKRVPAEKRASWRMVTAQNTDTFETIGRRTGVSATAIEKVNGGVIRSGQKVIIPVGASVKNVVFSSTRGSAGLSTSTAGSAKIVAYKAKGGETLGDVAGRYNTSARDIAALNRLSATARLRAGQVIKVPVR